MPCAIKKRSDKSLMFFLLLLAIIMLKSRVKSVVERRREVNSTGDTLIMTSDIAALKSLIAQQVAILALTAK